MSVILIRGHGTRLSLGTSSSKCLHMEAGVVTTGLSYKSLLPKKQHHALPTAEWDHHPAPGRPEALHGEPRHSYPACWLRSSWALASKSLVRLLLKSRRPGEEGGAVFRLSSGGPCRLSEPGHSGEPGRVGSGQGHSGSQSHCGDVRGVCSLCTWHL